MHTLEKIHESIRALAPKWNLTVSVMTDRIDVEGEDFDLQFFFKHGVYEDWAGAPLEKPGALAFLKAVFEYPL